ncbi:MAG: S1 family peptidase [Cytophagaceae bacterium]|nr:S1 family peptidase [Cytophagaceae bacterium]
MYVLSNNHVFANVNQASPGDAIFQPGVADGGSDADAIATLTRWVPIQLNSSAFNAVDAAIARLSPGVVHRANLPGIGRIVGLTSAQEEMKICKFGRTSGYTEGHVTDVAYDAMVGMDHGNPNVFAKFENQIRIEAEAPRYAFFGLGGDSGSLVVSKPDKKAVGLYFAGPPGGSYGIANPIDRVLSDLKIELL